MLPSCAFARGAAANNSAAATIVANAPVLSHVLDHCFMLASPFPACRLRSSSFARGASAGHFGEGLKLRPIIISSEPYSNPHPRVVEAALRGGLLVPRTYSATFRIASRLYGIGSAVPASANAFKRNKQLSQTPHASRSLW